MLFYTRNVTGARRFLVIQDANEKKLEPKKPQDSASAIDFYLYAVTKKARRFLSGPPVFHDG